jgi:hypothetical protein
VNSASKKIIAVAVAASLLVGCSGAPVRLAPSPGHPPAQGIAHEISASACGFQLLLLIPISINSRQRRANQELKEQAAGDYITDIKIEESWFYGFVGTGYCTTLTATAIHAGT